MDRLVILKSQLDQIIDHCKDESPNEACGILTGSDKKVKKVFTMRNIDQSPITYHMDPREQFEVIKDARKDDSDIVGIYHSHTASKAYPSKTDMELAFYPDAAYVIVSLENKEPDVKAYKILENNIEKIELEIKS
jgi:proteasome lid subunit RPN8/RPN11